MTGAGFEVQAQRLGSVLSTKAYHQARREFSVQKLKRAGMSVCGLGDHSSARGPPLKEDGEWRGGSERNNHSLFDVSMRIPCKYSANAVGDSS